MYVPRENESKLDNEVEKCILISYKDGIKGYKIWNLITNKAAYIQLFREVNKSNKGKKNQR